MTNEAKPIDWVEYKSRGLKISQKKTPPFEEFMQLVLGMDQEIESSPFWRGDLYNYGLRSYGEDRVMQLFGPDTSWKTWQNNGSVCGQVEFSRRREGDHAKFSHHAEVAYLDPEDFKESDDVFLKSLSAEGLQSHYLQMSIDNMFTVSDLRKQIKSDKGILPSFVDAMEKIAAKLEKLTDDLPDDWEAEAMHLENAYHQVEFAIESGRNREIGKPAKIRIELPQEIEA